MSLLHQIVRLGVELGLTINDYNSCVTNSFDDIIKVTLAYIEKVKEGVKEGVIDESEIGDYFSLVGQSWASVISRMPNEFRVVTKELNGGH
jgi:hypothetical protein